jgi:hypothetical protein
MLTHEERFEVAQSLCSRFVAQYPEQVLLCGLYGSTARETDTLWSDLEMWFVVTDECLAQGQELVYRQVAVGYRVVHQGELEAKLKTPSAEWPYLMGVLSSMEVLYGYPIQLWKWLELGKQIPEAEFHAALKKLLPGLVVESYGRIHSCALRYNRQDITPAVMEVLHEMKLALCLLNRRWVTHDYYQGLVDSFTFPVLPRGYRELVPELYAAQKLSEILPLADQLVNNFWNLLAEKGLSIREYQKVEEIEL